MAQTTVKIFESDSELVKNPNNGDKNITEPSSSSNSNHDRNISETESFSFDSGNCYGHGALSSSSLVSLEQKLYKQSEKRDVFRNVQHVNAPNNDDRNINEEMFDEGAISSSTPDSLERKLYKQNAGPKVICVECPNLFSFDSDDKLFAEGEGCVSDSTLDSIERKLYKQRCCFVGDVFWDLRRVNAPNNDDKNINESPSTSFDSGTEMVCHGAVSSSTLDSLEQKLYKQRDVFRDLRRVNAPYNDVKLENSTNDNDTNINEPESSPYFCRLL